MPLIIDRYYKFHKLGGWEIDLRPSNKDEAGTTRYYGFISAEGAWQILRDNTTTGEIRYVMGKTDYDTNWTNRASLTYSKWNEVIG